MNHGLSDLYLDNVQQVIKQFFELHWKRKENTLEKKGSVEGNGNDMTYSESQVQDWCDHLFLCILPKDQRKLRTTIES